MKRTFQGTVIAVKPTTTSDFRGGCYTVCVRVDPSEMGMLTFTADVNLPHDDAREMGALVGMPDAVSLIVSTGVPRDTVKWIVTERNEPSQCANGEFGVEVNGRAYIYYKHAEPTSSDVLYRTISGREFGETIKSDHAVTNAALSDTLERAMSLLLRSRILLEDVPGTESLVGEIVVLMAERAGQ